MSARTKHPVSVRRGLCLGATILGLMGLSFGLAPGTVLASSPTDVYTEEPPPSTPPPKDNKKPDKKPKKKPGNPDKSGKKKSGNGDDDNGGNGSTSGAVVPGNGSGNPPSGSSGNGSGQVPVDASQVGQPGTQENIAAGDGAAGDGEETLAVTPASESKSDGGGSALPLILAILVGVPAIGVGAYFLWSRYRRGDDEYHDLNSAYGGE